jgi:hypothetical protein
MIIGNPSVLGRWRPAGAGRATTIDVAVADTKGVNNIVRNSRAYGSFVQRRGFAGCPPGGRFVAAVMKPPLARLCGEITAVRD